MNFNDKIFHTCIFLCSMSLCIMPEHVCTYKLIKNWRKLKEDKKEDATWMKNIIINKLLTGYNQSICEKYGGCCLKV